MHCRTIIIIVGQNTVHKYRHFIILVLQTNILSFVICDKTDLRSRRNIASEDACSRRDHSWLEQQQHCSSSRKHAVAHAVSHQVAEYDMDPAAPLCRQVVNVDVLPR